MWDVLAQTNLKRSRSLNDAIKVAFQNDLSPYRKVLSHFTTLLSWSYDDPIPVPSHPTMGLLTKTMVRWQHLKEEENEHERLLSR